MKNPELYNSFINKLKNKEKMEYITRECPFLVDDKCSIYNQRMSCCRNFPNKKGICADYECMLRDNEPNPDICKICNNKCCRRILYPKNIEFNLDFFIDLLNMDCITCSKLFEDYEIDE